MKLYVQCIEQDAACPMPAQDQVQLWVCSSLPASDQRYEVSVVNMDKEAMRALNHSFRGRDQVTNVLAFPIHELIDDTLYLGDVVCCGEVISEQAGQQHKAVAHHWAHLVVHALLHLQSYTHDHTEDAKRMEAMEVKILKSLDIPNPY
jgi:probable rRNA maturation factor